MLKINVLVYSELMYLIHRILKFLVKPNSKGLFAVAFSIPLTCQYITRISDNDSMYGVCLQMY